MPWVRKDDQMPIHRKVSPLSDAAYRLDDEAMCWASRNGTDGRIAADELAGISKRGTRRIADELVARRRWHRAGDPPCPSEHCAAPYADGWVIHDYLEYNPSASEVREVRRRKAERQRNWRAARSASRSASRSGERDALQDMPVEGAPRAHVSRPVPSRPEGRRDGDVCPDCGNPTGSAYCRNVCKRESA